MKEKKLSDTVVVITGASSGIGRAIALTLAQKGASLGLLSRDLQQLEKVKSKCLYTGAQGVLIEEIDVADGEAVKSFAKKTAQHFKKIDVWINNAGVTLLGRLEETPANQYRKVIETNFFGYYHGARAAVPLFREQGFGNLINISSQLGKFGAPYLSAYSASKFAINGFSESIRMELRDVPAIHVCTVIAATIDTPFFQHAANYAGREIKAQGPVYGHDLVVNSVLKLIEKPQKELYAGTIARLLITVKKLSPSLVERLMTMQVKRNHFTQNSAPQGQGNLFKPAPPYGSIEGGWISGKKADNKKLLIGLVTFFLGALLTSYLFRNNHPLKMLWKAFR
ncbi:SDR family oxidoreductase [Chitinispirillales bacterium ANBcel5]|uniref:SDR family oxidoreductase n=1 Tax=Cellulosispirillum alkaliphilum TaxID=3039283 RepID=UPI002A57346F|nr:SDR family oxidoreductase [Chitinispirillales bacterium ANBcel5]